MLDLVSKHHHPQPLVIVQRFHFHSRSRHEGESISAFVAELWKLSEHCKIQDLLNNMLQDCLVSGVNDSRLQCRLLAETDLTSRKALDLVPALEVAEQNAKDLALQTIVYAVHRQARSNGTNCTLISLCYRCGGEHQSTACKFKDFDCCNCGKKGHIIS